MFVGICAVPTGVPGPLPGSWWLLAEAELAPLPSTSDSVVSLELCLRKLNAILAAA